MALRRSSVPADVAEKRALSQIQPGMRALDGGAYLQLTLFYKGLAPEPALDANATDLDLGTAAREGEAIKPPCALPCCCC